MRACAWRVRIGAAVTGLGMVTGFVAGPAGVVQADVLDPVTTTVEGISGQPVGTGWLFDGAATTMDEVRASIGAEQMWSRGYTGKGVGIALVDTGVVPVDGLTSGNVVNGPDLSFESQSDDHRYLDTFGHGTHMAGIIAGRDPGSPLDPMRFLGVAPDARLTSIKVGVADGAVDVSQVIAAVDWVVAHRNDDPANPIRVLNLSYGTDGVQDYTVDPLTHAVENAWRAGIVVVVSGGNEGFGAGKLNDPAYDPTVLAVGAADPHDTGLTADDTVPDFSSRGEPGRRVDVVAPGRSIISLRDPGSYVDVANAGARVGDRFFKGSGTSQATAVVSGAVALLLQQRPGLTPDQVKALLRATAAPLPLADAAGQGAGEVNLVAASLAPAPAGAAQSWEPSRGTGSLEAARGSAHVADGDVELTGERDILGPWNADKWAAASSEQTSWVAGRWNNRAWTGDCWCGSSWADRTWSSVSWAGSSWAGRQWAGRQWAGRQWAGRQWAGDDWAGRQWAGRQWAGQGWS